MKHFEEIFTTSNPSEMDKVYKGLDQRISTEKMDQLNKEFIENEVKEALHQMNPNKALGLDGMIAYFFQRYWHILGKDIIKVIVDSLNNNSQLSKINHTNVVLIPKVKSPYSHKDFHPISLCNVIYKIISKVLVNRLKGVRNDIIRQHQSIFVPSRMIFYNAMVAYETIHTMKGKYTSQDGHMALKLYISKAYRVE